MKIIIFFCVALLPSIIHCSSSSRFDSSEFKIESPNCEYLEEALIEIIKNNRTINGIFKPSKNGFLGDGAFGSMYKGTLQYPNTKKMEVAMKFTDVFHKEKSDNEFKMYSYLYAIDNPKVELYGIPSVYYYGMWNDEYIMMGITLLDSGLKKTHRDGQLNELDLLIICKEFVRASKYMHSRGIYHRDVRFANFMFRRNNGFIIDYNMAEEMYNTTKLSPSMRNIGIKQTKNDWKSFLQSICKVCRVNVSFSLELSQPETENEVGDIMKALQTTDYHDKIKTVLVKMAEHVFGISKKNDKTSDYDRVYAVIEKEIASFGEQPPALVHWLTEEEKNMAKQEYSMNPVPSISSITDPLKLVQIDYPEIDWNYFQNKISQLNSGASSSGKKPRRSAKV